LEEELLGILYLWECIQTIFIMFPEVLKSTEEELNQPTIISNPFPVYSAKLLTQPEVDAF